MQVHQINSIIKNLAMAVVIGMMLLFLNYKIAVGPFGKYVANNFIKIFIKLSAFLAVWELIKAAYDLGCYILLRYSNKIWKKIKEEMEIGLEQNISAGLKQENTNFEPQYVNYLLKFINDKSIYNLLIHLKNMFYNDELSQSDIAFFFLVNRCDNRVIRFLKEFPDFKDRCYNCSDNMVNRFVYNEGINQFNSELLRDITNELLHFTIDCNVVDINEHINYIRKVLSLICGQVENKEMFSSFELKCFMLVIPRLEKRLKELFIDDEVIKTNIRNLKKSLYLKKIYFDSIRQLRKFEYESVISNTYSIGLILAYPEKFTLIYRLALLHTVKKRRILYKKRYHTYYYLAMTLLLVAIPLGSVNDYDCEVADKILSIINVFGGIT